MSARQSNTGSAQDKSKAAKARKGQGNKNQSKVNSYRIVNIVEEVVWDSA